MSNLKAVVIGCGQKGAQLPDGKHGFAIAYSHGNGYRNASGVELVAASDIDPENLRMYMQEFGLSRGYENYREMLEIEKPDIVSICTWPMLHKEMVIESAKRGVKGILCEKPMSFHYGDCKEMDAVCREHGVVLNISHQRRFGPEFEAVKQAIDDGEIGRLLRIETWVGDGWDLHSWGVHWVDIMRYYNNDAPVEYVFAQADISSRKIRYQHPIEDRILMQVRFANGVYGYLHHSEDPIGNGNLLVGDEGAIIVSPETEGKVTVVGKRGTRAIDPPGDMTTAYRQTIEKLVDSVVNGSVSGLDSRHALANMQIVMAAYESARTHRAIRLPFEPERNPLQTWLDEIDLKA